VRRLAAVLALLFGLGAADAAGRCYTYEPKQVTLVGTLVARTLPGPPNYVSVARGDLPESVLFLRLEEPICVSADPLSLRNSKGHAGITELQLVSIQREARKLLGKRVRITGSLSEAQGGQHRTPVLLAVRGLRPA